MVTKLYWEITMQPMNLPRAFMEKMKELLGEEWESFRECYENERYQALRFNPLKKGLCPEDYAGILNVLGAEEIHKVPWAEHAFYYEENRGEQEDRPLCRPGKDPYHEMGLYYIQEPSAMSAASLLHPLPGERILDLCAAPGGKSTQLASFLGQQGLLVANEIHPARAKILSQNMERMGIANAIVCNEDSSRLAEFFPEFFHRILVDAPCSGEGMFRKEPQAAEEWSPENVRLCAERQLEILENAAQMLMPDGTLVYSTCTFSPEENEGVIAEFLGKHSEFEVIEREAPYFSKGRPEWGGGNPELAKTFRLWPHKLHGEGHYAAVLQRKGEGFSSSDKKKKPKKIRQGNLPDKQQQTVLKEFLEETLSPELMQWILEGSLILYGEQLYRLPEELSSIEGLCVLRPGLHLGTFKKNRFEPSHGLALFLSREDVNHVVELSRNDEAVSAYLRGETILGNGKKGWCLICVDGYSAGWGKLSGGMVKNHYPKGLRK